MNRSNAEETNDQIPDNEYYNQEYQIDDGNLCDDINENFEDQPEFKKVKYVKLVPKKFKENYEIKYHDVHKKGQIFTIYADQIEIKQ